MSLKNLSTTAASNTLAPPFGAPETTTKIKDFNDLIRQLMADTRTLAASNTIASAATCDLGTLDETWLTVTGTTTITSFGTVSAGIYKFVTFSGALTLTHNATSLILMGGASRTTAAGDTALYLSLGGGNWKEYFYQQVGGAATYQPLDATLTALAGLNSTAGLVEQTGADAFTKRAIGTASGNIPAIGTKSATETLAGLLEIATVAEAIGLTDDTTAMTPAKTSNAIASKLNVSGAAPMYACRAWINFDGTSASIGAGRANGNVSSVTDNGVGDYTVNFATAMPDANYAVAGCCARAAATSNDIILRLPFDTAPTTTACRIVLLSAGLTALDGAQVHIVVFR